MSCNTENHEFDHCERKLTVLQITEEGSLGIIGVDRLSVINDLKDLTKCNFISSLMLQGC